MAHDRFDLTLDADQLHLLLGPRCPFCGKELLFSTLTDGQWYTCGGCGGYVGKPPLPWSEAYNAYADLLTAAMNLCDDINNQWCPGGPPERCSEFIDIATARDWYDRAQALHRRLFDATRHHHAKGGADD